MKNTVNKEKYEVDKRTQDTCKNLTRDKYLFQIKYISRNNIIDNESDEQLINSSMPSHNASLVINHIYRVSQKNCTRFSLQ